MLQLQKQEWDKLAAWRGGAALMVAFGHMVQVFIYPTSSWLAPYSGLMAQASVMMFFVISGCSIAASGHGLLNHKEPLRDYLWNRMARIFPPLMFAVLLMWLLALLSPIFFPSGTHDYLDGQRLARDGYYFDWQYALGSLIFINGFFVPTPLVNGPLWSLAYEIWLYLIFFIFLLGQHRKSYLLTSCALVLYLAVATLDQSSGRLLFAKYSLIWAAGTFVFYLLAMGVNVTLRKGYPQFLMYISGVFAFSYAWKFVRSDMNDDITPFNLTFGIWFALFLIWTPRPPIVIERLMIFVSKFGYTLYLIHFPIYLFVFGILQTHINSSLGIAVSMGFISMMLSLLIAHFSAKWLERKEFFLKLISSSPLLHTRGMRGRQ